MKRSPLVRKTPLRAKAPVKRKQSAPKLKLVSKLPPEPKRSRRGRLEEPDYLAWIRTKPCLVPGCSVTSQCHHYGKRGKSMKCDDSEVVPLCFHHHIEWFHTKGNLPGMSPTETRELFQNSGAEIRRAWERRKK